MNDIGYFETGCEISLMKVPAGFKIKKKVDVNTFINDCMQNGNEYIIMLNAYEIIIIDKKKDGNVSFSVKYGNVRNPFIPSTEIAATDSTYKYTVEECIWKYRKYINAKWFNN